MSTRVLELRVADASGTLVRLALVARRFGGTIRKLTVTTDPATGTARTRIADRLGGFADVHAVMR